ncbi:MAG TPA: aminoglycoside phosphotransferase family protein, partial [Chloroflexota bacterium]|nr:aminoglycoside phosphotransferase family protein [Chloroflexota bacterium]
AVSKEIRKRETGFINVEVLEACLPAFLGRDRVTVASVDSAPLNVGTSGAELHSVTVNSDAAPEPLKLLLKISPPESTSETCFYRDLAAQVPLSTPRLVASGTHGRRTWMLLEWIEARPHHSWTDADYRVVVEDMARLHGSFWNRLEHVRRDWLTDLTDSRTLARRTGRLLEDLDTIERSWPREAVPGVFTPERLERIRVVVVEMGAIVARLCHPGVTLVHGDYWFYNVLLTGSGRRVLVDWQDPMIFSGFWELTYFMNLLLPLREGYRDIPVSESLLVSWYRSALRAEGVDLDQADFDTALARARVVQVPAHWVPQLARAVVRPRAIQNSDLLPATRFLTHTFDQWDASLVTAEPWANSPRNERSTR